jgi:diguanylate cyclase (GGDEF)-like protein
MTDSDILIVDDDPGTVRALGGILRDEAKLRVATNGKDALRLARETLPDLILLDAEMPEMSGFQVCETLKSDPELASASVIFVTSHSESDFEVASLEMGAADFISKPFSASRVLARVKAQLRVKRHNDDLRRAATRDTLTGVGNKQGFEESLEREWLRARRTGEAIAIMLVNVDHFDQYNEHYGFPAGDECLRRVAQALGVACQRPADMAARLTGGEFGVLMPSTPRAGAAHVGRRILDAIEALEIPNETSATARHVTVSIGIACYDDESAYWADASSARSSTSRLLERGSAAKLRKAAVNALYAAKRSGGDQARLLDIADCEEPVMARNIEVAHRSGRIAEPAISGH